MQTRGKRVLFVHSGSDLYGSGQTLLQSLTAIRNNFSNITLWLPEQGKLEQEARPLADNVILGGLFIFRRSELGTLLGFIYPLLVLYNSIKAALFVRNYDIVYINTIAPIGFIIAARFFKNRCILHVHEIPSRTQVRLFSKIVPARSFKHIIFNSQATKNAFVTFGGQRFGRGEVVLNSVRLRWKSGVALHRDERLYDSEDQIHILILGRLNAWKGHIFALKAMLQFKYRNRIILDIVGGEFGGDGKYTEEIREFVDKNGLESIVNMHGETSNPFDHLRRAHFLLVPSTQPEPFGLVAVEAFSLGVPVIAAGHGGLTEIVSHGKNGFSFEANSQQSLVYCLEMALELSATEYRGLRLRAHDDYVNRFSEQRYCEQIRNLFA